MIIDPEEARLYGNIAIVAAVWWGLRLAPYCGRRIVVPGKDHWTRSGTARIVDCIALLALTYIGSLVALVWVCRRTVGALFDSGGAIRCLALLPALACAAGYARLTRGPEPSSMAKLKAVLHGLMQQPMSPTYYIALSVPVFVFWLIALSLVGLYSHEFPWSEPTLATVAGSILATAFIVWAYTAWRRRRTTGRT